MQPDQSSQAPSAGRRPVRSARWHPSRLQFFASGLLVGLGLLLAADDRAGWETVTPTNHCAARHEAALAELHGKLYLLGGRGLKPVEEFDPRAGSWRRLAPPPFQMHHFQALAVGDRIAIVGALTGGYPQEPPVTNVWWFDPGKNEWSKGVAMPAGRGRGGAGAVLHGEKIYLIGGNTNGHWSGFVPWTDALDLKSGQWTPLPDAPHARDHFQAALVAGKIVAAGGRRSFAQNRQTFELTVPEVDVFDPAAGGWTTLAAKIPTPRAGCMAVARDGTVIVLGGESGRQAAAHNEVEALRLTTGRWETLPALNQSRHGTGAAFIGDELYVAAGCANRGGSPEINSLEKLHWTVSSNRMERLP